MCWNYTFCIAVNDAFVFSLNRDPVNWSEEDMRVLGPLLLLNDTVIEKLPAKVRISCTKQYYFFFFNLPIHPSILLICLAELDKVIPVRPDGQFA